MSKLPNYRCAFAPLCAKHLNVGMSRVIKGQPESLQRRKLISLRVLRGLVVKKLLSASSVKFRVFRGQSFIVITGRTAPPANARLAR